VRTPLSERRASADLVAETVASEALAVRLDRARLLIDGRHRRVVAYCEPDVRRARFAALLRELADKLDGGDP
jgi:hypothetical protein